jgi:hypothetical protein
MLEAVKFAMRGHRLAYAGSVHRCSTRPGGFFFFESNGFAILAEPFFA